MEVLSALQTWLKATTPSFQNLGNIKVKFPELETTWYTRQWQRSRTNRSDNEKHCTAQDLQYTQKLPIHTYSSRCPSSQAVFWHILTPLLTQQFLLSFLALLVLYHITPLLNRFFRHLLCSLPRLTKSTHWQQPPPLAGSLMTPNILHQCEILQHLLLCPLLSLWLLH